MEDDSTGRTEVPNRYHIKAGYQHRPFPAYFDDAPGETVWQPDVYGELAEFAHRLGALRLIDLGCGNGSKLAALTTRLELIGVDFGPNLQRWRDTLQAAEWLEHDLQSEAPLPLNSEQLNCSIIVCADVIEQLAKPEALAKKLLGALEYCEAIILSSPDRDLTWGGEHLGPPPNACHVREWALEELLLFLRSEGFQHIAPGHTRSNDRDSHRNTSLLTIFPDASFDKCHSLLDSPELYCISLERRSDRRTQALVAFERIGLQSVQIFPAFDAYSLNLSHPVLTRGEVGCYLSHLAILKMASARSLPCVAILEDDVVFPPLFWAELRNFLLRVPQDWDVLYFGGWHVEAPVQMSSYVCRLTKTFGTTMIVVRARAYETLLRGADDIHHQIDVYYAQHMQTLKFYCPANAIVYQSEGFSDVREEFKTNEHIR